ncbi:MAG TPA: YihA family ribosome biogenesis GTP-binding protein [Firmicutes bacterium]|jgi:GTP-binding protein|nr:YihA family ribosome biogenesis GTP-binding protein [Bacillota bacterium]HAA37329.1 YihA family ribosome biogenesis GTP-binding protein [Bacillota bacterium]
MKIKTAEFIISAVKEAQFPQTGLPEVAFVGRSNVGKSSLLNSLLNRKKLALTSSSPGKTRLINFFLINKSFYFVDLPGYGYARVSREMKRQWGEIIEDYLAQREPLKLVVQLVDVRHPPTADDLQMYQWLTYSNLPTVIVATKVDKITRGRWQKQLQQIRTGLGLGPQGPVIFYSSQTGQGKEELWRVIGQYVLQQG